MSCSGLLESWKQISNRFSLQTQPCNDMIKNEHKKCEIFIKMRATSFFPIYCRLFLTIFCHLNSIGVVIYWGFFGIWAWVVLKILFEFSVFFQDEHLLDTPTDFFEWFLPSAGRPGRAQSQLRRFFVKTTIFS